MLNLTIELFKVRLLEINKISMLYFSTWIRLWRFCKIKNLQKQQINRRQPDLQIGIKFNFLAETN